MTVATSTTTGATSTAPVLRAEGITLRFGAVTALSDVSIEVRPDEMPAIIGPSFRDVEHHRCRKRWLG